MKLVLYSGGYPDENKLLDTHLLKMTGLPVSKIKMTFIPASSWGADSDFREFVEQFSPYGVKRFLHFPIDVEFDPALLKLAFEADIVHLSGGNTYHLMKHIRKNKITKHLKDFIKRGGILTGLSAGAICMTQTIELAGIPSFDCDVNHEGMTDLKALGLLPFHFFPHYPNKKKYDLELANFSLTHQFPIYALPNGSGIIVNHDSFQVLGRSYMFFQGKKTRVC